MTPTLCPDHLDLQKLLHDQLDAHRTEQIATHLEHCHLCRQQLETLAVGDDSLASFESELRLVSSQAENSVAVPGGLIRQATQVLNPTDDPKMLGRLGRFEVSALIGTGSTGFVFKGVDAALSRPVALKLLSPAIAHLAASRKRFQREGRAIALVRDPHVVDVYGVEYHNEIPFIVMRYVAGESLQNRIDQCGQLSNQQVTRLGLQIASGLAAAHAQGIVHRDIKPANILLESGGERAIVSDFGLARVADDAAMTHTGVIAGTPQYMSPEQTLGKPIDERSDLFSLGCVLYACCTGASPFEGDTILGVMSKVANAEPPSIRERNSSIAPWLTSFIAKLMAKRPDQRFQTASEVAEILKTELAYAQSPRSLPPPDRTWAANREDTKRSRVIVGSLALLATLAFSILLIGPAFDGDDSANDQQKVADELENSTNAKSRIQPFDATIAEKNRALAKTAYDLSYETHVQEAFLSGDMNDSIQRHLKALRLGYNPAYSSFHLARAYAIEGRADESFEWLRNSLKAGFCDVEALRSNRDFRKLRMDERFASLERQVTESSRNLDEIKQAYFQDANYLNALKLGKLRLEKYPHDEFTQLLVAGALTELAFFDPSKRSLAKTWNQRIRSSVRYANYGNYNLGCLALMDGRLQAAFDHLSYAVHTGFTDGQHMVNDPMLLELHGDPRFDELARRLDAFDDQQ